MQKKFFKVCGLFAVTLIEPVSNYAHQAWNAASVIYSTHGREVKKKFLFCQNTSINQFMFNCRHNKSEARMARLTALVIPATTHEYELKQSSSK
jgi:hypothetical protein